MKQVRTLLVAILTPSVVAGASSRACCPAGHATCDDGPGVTAWRVRAPSGPSPFGRNRKEDRRMTVEAQGVVAAAKGTPVELTTVLVPDPGPGEARVRVQACGVCHTDLHYREGGIGDEFPYLLGHEAAGVVEAVGGDVTDVAPGD